MLSKLRPNRCALLLFADFFYILRPIFLKKGYEIMKNFKILSGLSLATVLALIPAQSLAKNSIVTQGSLTQTSGNGHLLGRV